MTEDAVEVLPDVGCLFFTSSPSFSLDSTSAPSSTLIAAPTPSSAWAAAAAVSGAFLHGRRGAGVGVDQGTGGRVVTCGRGRGIKALWISSFFSCWSFLITSFALRSSLFSTRNFFSFSFCDCVCFAQMSLLSLADSCLPFFTFTSNWSLSFFAVWIL